MGVSVRAASDFNTPPLFPSPTYNASRSRFDRVPPTHHGCDSGHRCPKGLILLQRRGNDLNNSRLVGGYNLGSCVGFIFAMSVSCIDVMMLRLFWLGDAKCPGLYPRFYEDD